MSRRRSLRLRLATALGVCLALPAFSQEAEIRTWTAPPYWAPPASADQPDPHPANGRTAEGRQTLAAARPPSPSSRSSPAASWTRAPAAARPSRAVSCPAATVRSYTLTGVCNVPANAQAISLNVTVVKPVGPGFLAIWPEGGDVPSCLDAQLPRQRRHRQRRRRPPERLRRHFDRARRLGRRRHPRHERLLRGRCPSVTSLNTHAG